MANRLGRRVFPNYHAKIMDGFGEVGNGVEEINIPI